MAASVFVIWDYLVLAGFFAISTLIGLYFAWVDRNEQDNRNFITAKKQLGWKPVALSMMATLLSSTTILGFPAQVFLHGAIIWISALGVSIAILIASLLFLPVFYNMNITCINEYLEKRYKSPALRKIVSLVFIVQTLLYMGVTLYGPVLALSSVTGVSISNMIIVNGLVCTMYTTLGGIKAVIWTDVLQMILIYVGFFLVIVSGLIHLGGFSNMWRIADQGGRLIFSDLTFNPYVTFTTWNVLLSWTIVYGSVYCASQTQVQRYVSIGSFQDARKACLWNVPGVAITLLLSVFCGLILYAIYGNCDPRLTGNITKADQLMPYIVQDLLRNYPGFSGLLVSSVFSGSLSSLSSGYNALAAITWDDFIKHRVTWSGKKTLLFTKLAATIYGIMSICVAFLANSMESIIEAATILHGAMTGPQLSIFLLGVLVPGVKKQGALIGLLGGLGVSSWIAIGAVSFKRTGHNLVTTTADCTYLTDNVTLIAGSFDPVRTPEGILKFYHISFIWISSIGMTASLVFALFGYFVFDRRHADNVDPKYIAPIARRFIFNSTRPSSKTAYTTVPSNNHNLIHNNVPLEEETLQSFR